MNWPKVPIGSVADILPGFAFKSIELGDQGTAILKIGNINDDGTVDTDKVQRLPTQHRLARYSKYELGNRDIIIAMTGATAGKAGRIRTSEGETFLLNQRVAKLCPQIVDPDYFWFVVSTDAYRNLFYGLGGGAAQPNMSGPQIASVEIPLPPVQSQKRIAAILSAYDDLIEKNRRRIALLEDAARQLYKEWFVRFRFPGHEHVKIIDGVPEGWERQSVAELSSFLSRGITPVYDEEAAGLIINQKCIRDSKVSLEPARPQSKTVPDKKLVRKFDVLINSTGAGTLGRVAQNFYEHENLAVDSHVTIARPAEDVAPVWFGIALTLKQDFIATLGRGATSQTELSKDDVGAIVLDVPDNRLLWEFEEQVADCAKMVMNLVSQNFHLAKARDLVLPKLMSGAIDV